MAKITITHTCGHEQTHNLVGPHKERANREAWLETTLCYDCYQAEEQRRREQAAEKAIACNRDADLPPLLGSEAQIRWAETLRADTLRVLLQRLEDGLPWLLEGATNSRARSEALRAAEWPWTDAHARAAKDAIRPLLYEWASTQTACRWWIDNRDYPSQVQRACAHALADRCFAIVEALAHGENPAQAEARLVAEQDAARRQAEDEQQQAALAREQARRDALLLAPNTASPLAADIVVQERRVCITFSERNDTVYTLLRSLAFTWETARWEREGDDAAERAVEAACRLLASGISVRLYDPELRRRALSGDYSPLKTRWLRVRLTGKYAGWFVLQWGRHEDYYTAAKRLRGARYDKPQVIVPADAYADVADFARLHGFAVSQAAQDAIDVQIAARAQSVVASLPPLPAAPSPLLLPTDKPLSLPIPDSVEIADSLREDVEEENVVDAEAGHAA